jgi:hypothetical protein
VSKQAFRVGDRVRLLLDSSEGSVVEARYSSGREHPSFGQITRSGFLYKVAGEKIDPSLWYSQGSLKSVQPCPNCNAVGWDWIGGCGECGLSPEDR